MWSRIGGIVCNSRLLLADRGRGYKDLVRGRRAMVGELGLMTFHVIQDSRIRDFPDVVVLVTREALAVRADGARTGDGLFRLTILSEKGHRTDEEYSE